MTWPFDLHPADALLLAVVLISLSVGFWRGMTREFISLLGWVLAFLVARACHDPLSQHLAQSITTPSVRWVTAYALLFIGTLVVCSLLAFALSALIRVTGLSLIDRTLGSLFGAFRGVLLIAVALLLVSPFVREDPWFEAAILPQFLVSFEPWLRAAGDAVVHFSGLRDSA